MWTLIIVFASSLAHAGWAPTVEDGSPPPYLLAQVEQAITHCPAAQSEWIARYQGGAFVRVAPIAGAQDDNGALQSCLQAGLKQHPLPVDGLLRLSFKEPAAQAWELRALQPLNQQLGPRAAGSCATLRFPIDHQGKLGLPTLAQGSGDIELDTLAMLAGRAPTLTLPPVPSALQPIYGDSVDLCVSGVQAK
jgi:hypothetical protein